MHPSMTLGIPQLPLAESGLTAGCLHAVVCEQRALACGVLLSIAQQRGACVLTVAVADGALRFPDALLPRIQRKEAVFLAPRSLPTSSTAAASYLTELSDALRRQRSPAESWVVVLEGIEEWALPRPPAAVSVALDACRHWAVGENVALVLVFGAWKMSTERQAWLREMAWHYFSGLAWLQASRSGQYRWCTQFWHGMGRLALATSYALKSTTQGTLTGVRCATFAHEAMAVISPRCQPMY